MKSKWQTFIATLMLGLLLQEVPSLNAGEDGENRWETEIRALEARDARTPPPEKPILFVGSSSIRLWDLSHHFPGLPVVNHGFGGSEIADSIAYADRIILPLAPPIIVLYAGDNDIASGKTPDAVAEDYAQLVKLIHADLPETRIIYISIKPSLQRWHLREQMREANSKIRKLAEADPRLIYLDVDTPMIGSDGKPRPELFAEDGLHLNEAGYKLWTRLLRPHLR